ncbi:MULTISPECIES: sensor histidine kinase [unclassified Rhodococcus (in: high G+C Gram-positive bacteria)]|uniref:sensor histidine kinase n=1 Tax=unclassified Rhodococcus (in: high G+C Gram-positive bacteria) TaxID=192944 RepID=UPI00289DDE4E|nr:MULTISPECIES: sensor histidine kinase [unclassified Rhodococcus (in: high G+C Gram-positive bacteria)]
MRTDRRDTSIAPRDLLIALGVAIVQVGGSIGANHNQSWAEPLDAAAFVLLVCGPLALVFRRLRPVTVLLVVLTVTVLYVARGYGYGPVFMSLVVAFLGAATAGSRWLTYPVLAIGYVVIVFAVPAVSSAESVSVPALTGIAAWMLVLLAVAEIIRQRRGTLDARRQRAEAAQRSTLDEQRRRASEERLAIARELHDVLAHSLSLINVQASVALELWDSRPEQSQEALSAIKVASRDAIGDVHALLASLRGGEDSPPVAPTAGIGDLDGVVERARAAGLTVTTVVDGAPRPLPTVVDVAAARIVQESLTNVARHSGGSSADVTVSYTPTSVRIRIDDDGRGPAGTSTGGGGNGIPGMRERARALGGELAAGSGPGGGFRVQATLPFAAGTASRA